MSIYNLEAGVRSHDDDHEWRFHPYVDNGGTLVAVAGDNYVVIGADTRLIRRNTVLNRHQERLMQLSPTAVFAASNCWADALTLYKMLKTRVDMYAYEHHRPISTTALAQLIITTLYYRRFFPYAIVGLLAGLDESGSGCVYTFDPIGHAEKTMFTASGRSESLLLPLLDNQLGNKPPVSEKKAIALIRDGFACAAEREVSAGDSLQVLTIRKGEQIAEKTFALRKD